MSIKRRRKPLPAISLASVMHQEKYARNTICRRKKVAPVKSYTLPTFFAKKRGLFRRAKRFIFSLIKFKKLLPVIFCVGKKDYFFKNKCQKNFCRRFFAPRKEAYFFKNKCKSFCRGYFKPRKDLHFTKIIFLDFFAGVFSRRE